MRRTPDEAERTREAVLNAALHVFGRRGFAATTLQQIADEARVTRGAIYGHFSGKADLYLALLREKSQHAQALIEEVLASDDTPLIAIERLMVRSVELLDEDEAYRRVLEISWLRSEAVEELKEGFEAKVRRTFEFLRTLTALVERGAAWGSDSRRSRPGGSGPRRLVAHGGPGPPLGDVLQARVPSHRRRTRGRDLHRRTARSAGIESRRGLIVGWPFLRDSRPRAMMDIVDAFVRRRLFSGTVLVQQGDRILLRTACGCADVERPRRNKLTTVFRIGSMTKTLTAVATLAATERGRVALDDPVRTHLPDRAFGADLRIEHLLSNRSGLADYFNLPVYEEHRTAPISRADLLSAIERAPRRGEPGAHFAYSNSNWVILAEILERVFDRPFPVVLDTVVRQPLGMTHTGFASAGPRSGHARGYERTEGSLTPVELMHPSMLDGAGGIASTVDDLWALDWGLRTGRVLRPDSVARMEQAGPGDYGLGCFIEHRAGRRSVYHEGGQFGFVSGLYRFPEDDAAIVLLSNIMDTPLYRMRRCLTAALFHQPYELDLSQTHYALDPAAFAPYAGVFEGAYLNRPARIELFEKGGRFWMNLAGWKTFELTPVARHRFFTWAKGGELLATFVDAGSGSFDTIDMVWAGTPITFRRVLPEPPAR